MIEIVRAEEKHVPDIGRLWLEFIWFHTDIEPIFEPEEGAEAGFLEVHLKKYMESGDSLVLVALDDGTPVGYSIAEIKTPHPGAKRSKFGYLDTLAVTADYRRQGVGEKLYSAVLDWYRDRGIERVELELTSRNNVSVSFWGKQGYTEFMKRLYRNI